MRSVLRIRALKEFAAVLVMALAVFALTQMAPVQPLLARLAPDLSPPLLHSLVLATATACGGLLFLAMRRRRDAEGFFARAARAEEEAYRLAHYDPLTGLPNRRLCQDRLGQLLAAAARDDRMVAVLAFDLDGFQAINDSLGPTSGDLLLQTLSQRLNQLLRRGETCGRVAADEFVAILADLRSETEVSAFVRRLQACIAEPVRLTEQEVSCSAGIGIAMFPWDGTDASTLLRNAAIALNTAKKRGVNRVQFFGQALNLRAKERFQLENGLRAALKHNDLLLYYQPQISLETGAITGLEALIRWRHPVRGLIPPDRFIPAAEGSGMMAEMGEFVLRQACAQMALWRRMGFEDLRMAVNISPSQVNADLLRQVENALMANGLPAEMLEIELTESGLIRDLERARTVLGRLAQMGVTLSLDDFGTGYSSLKLLQTLQLHRIKIDRSFIQSMLHDPGSQNIVLATIALGRELGLDVLAEGVETWPQLHLLRQHRCPSFQGFLFSPPLDVEAATRQLNAGDRLDVTLPFALGDISPTDFEPGEDERVGR